MILRVHLNALLYNVGGYVPVFVARVGFIAIGCTWLLGLFLRYEEPVVMRRKELQRKKREAGEVTIHYW